MVTSEPSYKKGVTGLYKGIKRILDIVLTILSAPLTIPMLALLALAIRIDTPGSVFFKQKRVGRNRSHFEIYKFRTMRIDTPRDTPTHLLESPEQYITRVGGFMRKTSLDELPQLINILKGDMSFVGPRPALWNQFDLVKLREKYGANGVRPGLTGLAQISGRDELPIEEKAAVDGKYIEKFGFCTDVKIFFGTFGSVLRQKGVREGKDEMR